MRHRIHIIIFLCLFTGVALESNAQNITRVTIQGAPDGPLKEVIEENVSRFLTGLNTAYHENARPAFEGAVDTTGRQTLGVLWDNVPFYCAFPDLSLKLLRTKSGFEVRNIPLTLRAFDASQKRQQREGVILLAEDGRILDLYFGIEEHQYAALLLNPDDNIDLQRRQTILSFVENVRTAYNRKDLPLIERVYSDNALIIIGRVVEEDPAAGAIGTSHIEYVRRDKAAYLAQLREVFASNEFINIDFEDIQIVRHPVHKDFYGVTLLQYWESSNYSDAGYLFLVVDFREEERPIIHVRTWQPREKIREGEVFQLNDFWINTR